MADLEDTRFRIGSKMFRDMWIYEDVTQSFYQIFVQTICGFYLSHVMRFHKSQYTGVSGTKNRVTRSLAVLYS